MILQNHHRRKTGLAMAWIDYKKAFDMVPHSWILKYLDVFGIVGNIRHALVKNRRNWKTELKSSETSLGRVKFKRDIFQGGII